MRYGKFYREKLEQDLLERIDAEQKEEMRVLIGKLESGNWTEKQKKRQKSSILSNIALYRTLVENGISKEEAYELVKEHSFYVAKKAHNILGALPLF